MSLVFEWDEDKAASNLKKHRVSFQEAATVFADPLSEYRLDHSKARPNRFAARLKQGSRVVVIDPDIAKVFASAESVNAVLRALIETMPRGDNVASPPRVSGGVKVLEASLPPLTRKARWRDQRM